MRAIYVLFIVAVTCGVLLAQSGHTVSGVARDRDGSAIPGVRIELKSKAAGIAPRTTVTDPDGRFAFTNVPDGSYELTGSRDGSQVLTVEVTVSGSNVPESLFEFPDAGVIRENVTISIDGAQTIDEVSKAVSTITGQEMRERADFTLVDTLRTIPGFRVQQLGGFGRTASIKSRGLRNQDTAVLIDGVRFRDPGSITGDATPFLGDFTLTSVDRIEVLRGSGSSLYGTNAIGGTIDFRTPNPRNGFHGQFSGAAGGLGLGRFRSNLSYGTDKFGVSGAYSRTAYTKGIDGEDNARNDNFQGRLDLRPRPGTEFSGRFFFSDARVRLNSSPDTLGSLPPATTIIRAMAGVNFTPDVNDPDSVQDSRFFSGQFHASHIVSKQFVVSGYYQGLDTNRTNVDGPLGVGFQSAFTSGFGGTIHTANVHASWIPNDTHILTAGYEFETESFRNRGTSGADNFRTTASQLSNTLYAQHVISALGDRLQIAGGVRAQWFSLGRPEFSAGSNPYAAFTLADPPAAYTFDGSGSYFFSTTGTKLRFHAGTGYRVPSLYERFGTFFFFGAFFPQGNPELKPERSVGIDAGIDQYFFERRLRASATWFYSRIKDEITYLPTDDFGAPAYYNFDRHYTRGAEFSLDVRPSRSTDIFASYTFTNSDVRNFRRPGIVTLASSDRRAFGIPYHQFTLVVTQRIRRFWISSDILATSSYLAPVFSSSTFNRYTYRFGGNRRVDLTAGYVFPLRRDDLTLRLFGTIENLFDHDYFENGFRTPGRTGRVGLSFGF